MKHAVGFLQGRLSPKPHDRIQAFPKDTWREEFTLGQRLGFECVELIYDDLYLEDNPLDSSSGRRELSQLSRETGIKIDSICADYFMIHHLMVEDREVRLRNQNKAKELIGIAQELDCPLVEFPFVDSSSLSLPGKIELLIPVFAELCKTAEGSGVSLAMETDLPPNAFAKLLDQFPSYVGANFDLGNSASLGYDALAECRAFGKRIFNVHIKDRVLGGTTVPLTTGHVDFQRAFRGLKMADYQHNFILQTAPAPDFLEVAAKYQAMVRNWVKEAWT